MEDFFAPAPEPGPEPEPEPEAAALPPAPGRNEAAAGIRSAGGGGGTRLAPTLLVSQDGSNLKVHDEGTQLLAELGTAPVATVAVAGMYRTGKSFLLNQLLSGNGHFTVGNTTSSCTRGIWICVVPEDVWRCPSRPGTRLVVLDTEGLASIDQDETYDAKIFSLGILLSSFFVYNSMGVIDEAAIDRLFLVGELTKNISTSVVEANAAAAGGGGAEEGEGGEGGDDGEGKSGGDQASEQVSEGELAQFFPPFMWILRDFSLKLKDNDGRDISLHTYLEMALEDKQGNSRRVRSPGLEPWTLWPIPCPLSYYSIASPLNSSPVCWIQVAEHNRIRQSFRALFTQVSKALSFCCASTAFISKADPFR
eukprot:SAG22_NODE_2839_length_2165_cov_1.673282_2_plen_364_part_01